MKGKLLQKKQCPGRSRKKFLATHLDLILDLEKPQILGHVGRENAKFQGGGEPHDFQTKGVQFFSGGEEGIDPLVLTYDHNGERLNSAEFLNSCWVSIGIRM